MDRAAVRTREEGSSKAETERGRNCLGQSEDFDEKIGDPLLGSEEERGVSSSVNQTNRQVPRNYVLIFF